MQLYTSYRPTNVNGTGIGMQIYSAMCTLQYCIDRDVEYIHAPLPDIIEAQFNMNAACSLVLGTEDILKLTKNYKPNREYSITSTTGDTITNITYMFNINYILKNNIHINLYNVAQKLQKLYSYNQNNRQANIDVCIHIRRGDCTNPTHTRQKIRRVDDSFANRCLKDLSTKTGHYDVTIHSDSALDSSVFDIYKNINLLYNTPRIDNYRSLRREAKAMHHMITCDILYRTKCSTFSGVCAMFNKGTVFSDQDYNLFNTTNSK